MTRSRVLNVRLSAEDHRFLEEWANFKGATVSDMARDAIVAFRHSMADPVELRRRRDEHLREARRLETLLPEAERAVGEMREEAAQRQAEELLADPVETAAQELYEEAIRQGRRPGTYLNQGIDMTLGWIDGQLDTTYKGLSDPERRRAKSRVLEMFQADDEGGEPGS